MTAEAPLPDTALTEKIIAAAMEVHRILGPGFLESVYEEALCIELRRRGIAFERQKSIDVPFRDESAGEHRLDLLVESRVIVELKAGKAIEPIFFARLRSSRKRCSSSGASPAFRANAPASQAAAPFR